MHKRVSHKLAQMLAEDSDMLSILPFEKAHQYCSFKLRIYRRIELTRHSGELKGVAKVYLLRKGNIDEKRTNTV